MVENIWDSLVTKDAMLMREFSIFHLWPPRADFDAYRALKVPGGVITASWYSCPQYSATRDCSRGKL